MEDFQKGVLTGALVVAALLSWQPRWAVRLSEGAHVGAVWAQARWAGLRKGQPVPTTRAPLTAQGKRRRTAFVAAAMRMRGKPYLYGGDSPASGFDCSGLVQYSLHQAGVQAPRSAADQAAAFTPVDPGQLRPGDLVLFLIVHPSAVGLGLSKALRWVRWPPDHVGIYLGKGLMLHAPRSGGQVEVADLKKDFWRSRFVGARSGI